MLTEEAIKAIIAKNMDGFVLLQMAFFCGLFGGLIFGWILRSFFTAIERLYSTKDY